MKDLELRTRAKTLALKVISVCDFIANGFCEILEKVVGYDCKVIDYAR